MKRSAMGSLLVLALVPVSARAQRVTGVVLEEGTRTPVSRAEVSLRPAERGEAHSVLTDSLGAFRLELDTVGRFLVRVTHPSYTTVNDTVSVDEDEAVTLELQLARNAIPLAPLVVTARVDTRLAGFHERVEKNFGFGRFITRQDIDRRPGARVTELLRGMPGVRVTPVAPCRGCNAVDVIFLRGGANVCAPTVLIDGMQVKQDAIFSLDSFVLPETLEGIELYVDAAGVPASLGVVSSTCGVVALWTRTPTGGKLTWARLLIATGAVFAFAILLILH